MRVYWDTLDLQGIEKILAYWQERLVYYRAYVENASPFDDDAEAYAAEQIPVVESRIRLWQTCLDEFKQGRKIYPLLLRELGQP